MSRAHRLITCWHFLAGFHIVIEHANGVKTQYFHGEPDLLVETGDKVTKGTPLMYMGASGRAVGRHLHLGLFKDGKYYDANYYLKLIP